MTFDASGVQALERLPEDPLLCLIAGRMPAALMISETAPCEFMIRKCEPPHDPVVRFDLEMSIQRGSGECRNSFAIMTVIMHIALGQR